MSFGDAFFGNVLIFSKFIVQAKLNLGINEQNSHNEDLFVEFYYEQDILKMSSP